MFTHGKFPLVWNILQKVHINCSNSSNQCLLCEQSKIKGLETAIVFNQTVWNLYKSTNFNSVQCSCNLWLSNGWWAKISMLLHWSFDFKKFLMQPLAVSWHTLNCVLHIALELTNFKSARFIQLPNFKLGLKIIIQDRMSTQLLVEAAQCFMPWERYPFRVFPIGSCKSEIIVFLGCLWRYLVYRYRQVQTKSTVIIHYIIVKQHNSFKSIFSMV